jgi:TonB family protein
MTESRPFPLLWIAALALMVAACLVGLALQFGAYRSELVDRARSSDEHVPTPRTPGPPPAARREEGLPAYGEYVHVEELPEAITKVAPEYPDEGRMNGVEGTVIVQALIGRDGLVKETKVTNSVPELDAAAVSAVSQWTFKPAMTRGEPVAVWVAVPVKFTLK